MRWFIVVALGKCFVMGGMAEMVSHGSMGLVVCHKAHWYNGLLWFVMYNMDEMARHGWNK